MLNRLVEATGALPGLRSNTAELILTGEPEPCIGAEVWCRYQNRWVGGFDIARAVRDGHECRYLIRRNSDGYVLPETFAAADLRPAKRV